VWPWIAQLGQDKAGFYSFACLENALGCQVRNADHIVPEWQHPHVGDPFPLHPDIVLRIALIEPGHAFVVSSAGGSAPKDMGFEFTWAFVLTYRPGEGDGGGATRLHVRERYEPIQFGARPHRGDERGVGDHVLEDAGHPEAPRGGGPRHGPVAAASMISPSAAASRGPCSCRTYTARSATRRE
jgi:hypothetical protein